MIVEGTLRTLRPGASVSVLLSAARWSILSYLFVKLYIHVTYMSMESKYMISTRHIWFSSPSAWVERPHSPLRIKHDSVTNSDQGAVNR